MTEQHQREWLTARQAADRLKMTERHVHRLGEEGKIERKRLGPRRVLFRARDVDRLAEEMMVDLKPEPVRRDQAAMEALEVFRRNSAALDDVRQQFTRQGQTLDQVQASTEEQRATLQRLDERVSSMQRMQLIALITTLVCIVIVVFVLAIVLIIT